MTYGFFIIVSSLYFIIESYYYCKFLKKRYIVKEKMYYSTPNYLINDSIKYIKNMEPMELYTLIRNIFTYKDGVDNITNLSNIPKINVQKYFASLFFCKSLWELNSGELDMIDENILETEFKLKIAFTEGFDKNIFSLRIGKNKVNILYKPIFIYNVLWLVKNTYYLYMNYKKYIIYNSKNSNIKYLIKDNNKKKTIVFIHGIGLGPIPYNNIISEFELHVNIILIIIPNISNLEFTDYNTSFTFFNTVNICLPDSDHIKNDLLTIINRFKFNSIHCIAHSYGTIFLKLILNYPEIRNAVDKIVFIDPVCFKDEYYKIFYIIKSPFLYNRNPLLLFLKYFLYNDIYVNYSILKYCNNVVLWNNNNIDKCKTLIVLSDSDRLISSKCLKQYFIKNNYLYFYLDDAGHGDIFTTSKYINYKKSLIEYSIN